MVVCKCRKATKLYCFVHKVPICGECICFPEHQICVVRTYSEWVIDGEYDWPPNCCKCQAVLDEGVTSQITRLGCLHVIHKDCLASHFKSFPPRTAPAGYVCPACSTSIWPPKNFKDSGSPLHSQLKEAIMQTGIEKNLLGNHSAAKTSPDPSTLSTSASSLINGVHANNGYSTPDVAGSSALSVLEIVEIDVPNSAGNVVNSSSPVGAGATTRKGAFHVDRQSSDIPHYSDDDDANSKKYSAEVHIAVSSSEHCFLFGPLHCLLCQSLHPHVKMQKMHKKGVLGIKCITDGHTKDNSIYCNYGMFGNYGCPILQNCAKGSQG